MTDKIPIYCKECHKKCFELPLDALAVDCVILCNKCYGGKKDNELSTYYKLGYQYGYRACLLFLKDIKDDEKTLSYLADKYNNSPCIVPINIGDIK